MFWSSPRRDALDLLCICFPNQENVVYLWWASLMWKQQITNVNAPQPSTSIPQSPPPQWKTTDSNSFWGGNREWRIETFFSNMSNGPTRFSPTALLCYCTNQYQSFMTQVGRLHTETWIVEQPHCSTPTAQDLVSEDFQIPYPNFWIHRGPPLKPLP